MTQKILLYDGIEYPKITYEDKDVYGLSFEIIKIIGTRQYMLIDGADTEIAAYIVRNPEVVESSIDNMIIDTETGTITCSGSGDIASGII